MHQIRFWLELRPRPRRGCPQFFLRLPSWNLRVLLLRGENENSEIKREKKGRDKREMKGRKKE